MGPQAISRVPGTKHSGWVREYYSLTLEGDTNPAPRTVIDDCCYDFIFYKEGRGHLLHGPEQEYLAVPFKVFTIHNLQPPFRFHFDGPLTFFTIKLQPWSNAYFFGSLGPNGIYDLSKAHPAYSEWHRRIFETRTPDKRFLQADWFLTANSPVLSEKALRVKSVCEEIYRSGGMIGVGALSEQFEISRQHLNRIFKNEVMYSLKHFILTVRMMELVKYRLREPEESLTELAHRFEYFDQSHFNRDFQKFCGMTPSEFFRAPPEFMERHST